MCGIAGAVHFRIPLPPRLLDRMASAMRHRGPDDRGQFLNTRARGAEGTGGAAGLVAVRLSIIDLAGGHQPMQSEDGSVTVVQNGEIYNYRELRSLLAARGRRFRTGSDTEVILEAYREFGEGFLERLNGMFALAVWDEPAQRLLLARDRAGEKPLLYAELADGLAFASEFAALLEHPAIAREADLEAIHHYLTYLCVPAPLSAFRGIRKLPPGHRLLLSPGRREIGPYWTLDFTAKRSLAPGAARADLRHHLEDAVRSRLVSDVPLGAFLSGGLDSTVVVGLMSRLGAAPVRTFSIGFEEDEFNELPYARAVARMFGTDHHEFVVKPDATAVVPRLVRHYGEPYADSSALPTYYLAQVTREHVKVALSGDGGDELFGGYLRQLGMRHADLYARVPGGLRRRLLDPLWASLGRAGRRGPGPSLLRFLQAAGAPRPARYARWMGCFTDEEKQSLYSPEFRERVRAIPSSALLAPLFGRVGSLDGLDAALYVDTVFYLPNDLLVKVDIASMAHSLEVRAPLLDHRLVEFCAGLPGRLKVPGRELKALFKAAAGDLMPPEVRARGKQGFGVPLARWFRGPLADWLRDALGDPLARRGYFSPAALERLVDEHLRGRADHAHRLWTLLMLELWHREFLDSPEPADGGGGERRRCGPVV